MHMVSKKVVVIIRWTLNLKAGLMVIGAFKNILEMLFHFRKRVMV